MKILLFITSFRQVLEFKYFLMFFKSLKTLSKQCDILMYCNNVNVQDDIIRYFKEFSIQNKFLYITSKNEGYRMGNTEAMSDIYDMKIFQKYDYVIHAHPDVFIVDDTKLMDILETNLHNDICYLITKSVPKDDRYSSLDFFIFKPKLLGHNIFIDELYSWKGTPEHYFYEMLVKHDVKFKFIPRFSDDNYLPRRIAENIGIWHEHELPKVREYLQKNNLLLETSDIISPSELPALNISTLKQVTIQHTAEFNSWNLYLTNRDFKISSIDSVNNSVTYKNKNFTQEYLIVIDVFDEEALKRVNPILFSLHAFSSTNFTKTSDFTNNNLPDIVINTDNGNKNKIMQQTCIHLFSYKFIINDQPVQGIYNMGGILNIEKYKGILYLDIYSLLTSSIHNVFRELSSREKTLIYKCDKNLLFMPSGSIKDSLIKLIDSTKYVSVNISNICSNLKDYIMPFQNILKTVQEDFSNIDSVKSIIGNKYIWNHDIYNVKTTGYIEFLENGILQTTWQNGTYEFVNNNLIKCNWGAYKAGHYFIFNKDKNLVYSYRPHMSHFSCAVKISQ